MAKGFVMTRNVTRILLRPSISCSYTPLLPNFRARIPPTTTTTSFLRTYTTTKPNKMPESVSKQEINSKTDPSVAKQYDDSTPKDQQFKDLYGIIDGLKVSMMTTFRKDIGDLPVGRCMAISKRDGPDLLYLANIHSQKFEDLEANKKIQITFHNTSSQDWVSMTGEAKYSQDDPRIKDLYSPTISAWFGDLGDGVHNGTAEDPRMTLIEVKPKYIVYWKKEVTTLGFVKEVAQAAFQGDVAQTGSHRQLFQADIENARNQK